MRKGKFFVIDGTDGSGKKTQTDLLVSRLRDEGHKVETLHFPQYGKKSAGPVEAYLAGEYGSADKVGPKQGSILYAVDRYAASFRIRELLDAGVHVIADRYVASNMGHQGGKIEDPEERLAFFRWNDDLEYGTFNIPRPDLNIILHVPASYTIGLMTKRGEELDIHEKDIGHLQAAERTYLQIADTLPGFKLIECMEDGKIMPIDTIHEMVWSSVNALIGENTVIDR